MSLINEALKRAEAEKLRKADMKDAAALPPLVPERPGKRKAPAIAAILTALMIIACVGAGVSLLRRFNAAPKSSVAASALSRQPGQAKATVADQAHGDIDSPLTTATTATKAAQAVNARSGLISTSNQAAELNTTASERQDDQYEAAVEGAPVFDQPPMRTPPASAAPAGSPASMPAGGGGFRLSGIMSGPGSDAALINGQMVEVGQTIDGAKLVRVLGQAVELQVGERRFILRM
jgi:hypothetical protein